MTCGQLRFVIAVSAPTFVVLPGRVVAQVGGTASLKCSATGHQPLNYWWTKNSNAISSHDSRVVSHSNGTLEFVAVASDDTASYQCFANNSIGNVASNCAQLAIASNSMVSCF